MSQTSSLAVVVVVAASTGVALAPLARALGGGVKPLAQNGQPAAAVAAAHDDDEPDEGHSPSADNPYDDSTSHTPNATATPVHQPVVVSQDGMLKIPGNRFTMGSSNPHAPVNERPPRTLTLSSFWLDRTEVSVAAYRSCVDAGACAKPAKTSSACTFEAGDPDLPVSCVHWRDSDAYCRFVGKRLPTEREWEYAARGTLATPFPWGVSPSCLSAVTLISEFSAKSCAPRPGRVGTHPGGASTFGVQDMSGNVEEWVSDWYVESLGPGPAPRSGAAHVLRGGGWLSPPSAARTTSRNWGSAIEAGPNVGFRCAKDAE